MFTKSEEGFPIKAMITPFKKKEEEEEEESARKVLIPSKASSPSVSLRS